MNVKRGVTVGVLATGVWFMLAGEHGVDADDLIKAGESMGIEVVDEPSRDILDDVHDWDIPEVVGDPGEWFGDKLPEIDVSDWDVTEISERTVEEIQRINRARQVWLERDD